MLWLTHPKYEIGEPMRVLSDKPDVRQATTWAAWPEVN